MAFGYFYFVGIGGGVMDIISKHGGDIYGFAQTLACDVDEVVDLSSNINFLKPNITIDFNNIEIAPYPNYVALAQSIAKIYEVEPVELELFNGATSAIHTLLKILKLKELTLYAPLYGEYQRASEIYGYNIHLINRFEQLDQEVKEGSLVVFVNPSTPDGLYYEIDKLMDRWIEKKCTIFIDESFLEFTPYPSVIPYLKTYDRLYVLKSMTKFYGAAGIRIGVLLSHEINIQKIKAQEPLWKISEFDSQYLQSAIQDQFFPEISRIITKENRDYLINMLQQFDFVETIYPATANYLLVKLKKSTALILQQRLAPYKIMIRNCANFDFLDQQFVRIAVKDQEALTKLEYALCEIFI